ncbi:hypothetical protein FLM44_21050 [Pseudoalteromonas luteoviolacea]|nr:hypothetical protein FLM44_21050 [Pseudoalteromonas luteoviolacea]
MLCMILFPLSTVAQMSSEINHLLDYVEQSGCQYERNGSFHSAIDARAHITKKYKYYQDDIESTEDFIMYAASKSALSGKYYKIHCEGQNVVRSKDWLMIELNRFRQKLLSL